MFFKLGKGFTHLFVMLLSVYLYQPSTVQANAALNLANKTADPATIYFTAQPEQCVTLRQGRSCFASIQVQWQSSLKQSLCLYVEGQPRQVKCWKNHDHGELSLEFESNDSINYQLRRLSDNKMLAQAQIKVSWVHKSSTRKRRWRLF